MSRYRLTRAADLDIESILRDSARMFGPIQQQVYASLLDAAARMVAEQPDRPGSRDRKELGKGVRSFPVSLAANRSGAAAHVLFYLPDPDGATIVRVLHEAMDPLLHLEAPV
ncbi:MAG TPA: type II toxin-antitoxin system RelE/ParE family toxin [Candidatus Omnitrophota bacterium]|nr:type II toxin-antitoxin system RelE/ParE family toxin [Candidatus Omnitrophota bacterium]